MTLPKNRSDIWRRIRFMLTILLMGLYVAAVAALIIAAVIFTLSQITGY